MNNKINSINIESQKSNIIIITLMTIIALLLRVNFTTFDIPVSLDGLEYYSFGYEIALSKSFPVGILGTNDGWALFLSPFFMLFNNTDFMTLNLIQRSFSIVLSVITVIPVYYLCKQFVSGRFAIIGASLFIFDPRIITNSVLGITEPLFIFLNTLILVIIFKNNSKFIYLTFVLIALSSIVRYEGLLMIIPVTIIYFIRFRSNKKLIRNFLVGVILFLIVLSPIIALRTNANGMDGLSSHIFPSYISAGLIEKPSSKLDDSNSNENFLLDLGSKSIFNTLKYIVWVCVPLFVIFLPIGLYRIFQDRNNKINYLILLSAFMIIPALYAYGREIQEPRYLLVLIPIFSVVSVYGLNKFRLFSNNFWIIIFFIGIILASVLFLWYIQDEQYIIKKETYYVSKVVADIANGVNNYERAYLLKPAELDQKWPKPLQVADSGKLKGEIITQTKRIVFDNSPNLEEFIQNSRIMGLSHLVIFEKNQEEILNQVFLKPEKYPYLEIEFDSEDMKFMNKIRIYKINYDEFDRMLE